MSNVKKPCVLRIWARRPILKSENRQALQHVIHTMWRRYSHRELETFEECLRQRDSATVNFRSLKLTVVSDLLFVFSLSRISTV